MYTRGMHQYGGQTQPILLCFVKIAERVFATISQPKQKQAKHGTGELTMSDMKPTSCTAEAYENMLRAYFDKCYELAKLKAELDHLISNGVTVQKSNCPYCFDDERVLPRILKHSYDDEDGMAMSIHPSPKRKDGTRSLAWWATVHFRGECRDFIIEACPFCGRKLVPLREEYDCCNGWLPKECE